MKLIVGLGNPGKKYERTRHNAGWLFLDTLAREEKWRLGARAKAHYLKTELNGRRVELIKPTTFMNNSGLTVAYALKKHGLSPANLIVVHDDKDITLGEFRVQTNRGAGGHNGVLSIIEHLGTKDFTRFRIGIAPSSRDAINRVSTTTIGNAADFVLGKLTASEQKTLRTVFDRVRQAIEALVAA